LNIGAMRETERILYRGLPWRVESINMYTTLKNPELDGEMRIPLAELHGISSRITGADSWFPTSTGDVVLMPNDAVLEVVRQNPDTVELRQRGGQMITIPCLKFYTQEMVNLTRGGSFGVSSTFGVGYEHQAISLTHIPQILASSVRNTLSQSGLESHIINVEVELKYANSSSLDYWIFVTCDSAAAHAYPDIRRFIQRACVDASTKESLIIPFPHISLIQNNPTNL
jgi:small-conductance mechanosensitive channel